MIYYPNTSSLQHQRWKPFPPGEFYPGLPFLWTSGISHSRTWSWRTPMLTHTRTHTHALALARARTRTRARIFQLSGSLCSCQLVLSGTEAEPSRMVSSRKPPSRLRFPESGVARPSRRLRRRRSRGFLFTFCHFVVETFLLFFHSPQISIFNLRAGMVFRVSWREKRGLFENWIKNLILL